ncbi:MFS transporter, partial [candidate division KSB1 bacterium]|nr:MFS transporter [candidate division KSB1 bacterium]
KKLTPVVAIMAVFTLAICFIMIGSISEELKSNLGIDNAHIGTLVFLFSITCIIVQLLAGVIVDRFGHKPMAIAGFLVSAGSIFLLAFVSSFQVAVLAAVLLGVGAICCNTVGNTLLPVVLFEGKDPARASNFGNAFVGLAFVLTPLLIVTLIKDFGINYNLTLSILAVLVLIFSVFSIISDYPQVSTGFKFSTAFKLLLKPAVLVAALALICYIGLEFTMNTWVKPTMTELYTTAGNSNAVRNAGRVLALFGLAMAIGRFITSALKNLSKIGAILIAALALVSVAVILILSKTSSIGVAIIMVLIAGLAFAPMFPTIVGVTFSKFEPKYYGSIFGVIFAVGLLGPMVLPKLIGNLSTGGSVQKSLPIAAVVAVFLVVVALLMSRTKGDKSQKEKV